MTNRIDEIRARVADYLSNGGLFNPELMDHDKVRDLIVDCRDGLLAEVDRLIAERDVLKAENAGFRFGLNVLTTTFYKDDQHQAYAKHILEASK